MTKTRCVPQSLKYLLSGAFQKFADPGLRTYGETGGWATPGQREEVEEGSQGGGKEWEAQGEGVFSGGAAAGWEAITFGN